MNFYPVYLQICDKKCLVVGGGRVAERKARGLLECQAKVHVVSPKLTPGLEQMQNADKITWSQRGYQKGDAVGFFLVMAATDDPAVQDLVQADAAQHNILLNVADVPDKCNFILPAQVKRGALSVSISTGGNSPALAKQLKKELGDKIGHEYEVLNDIMGLIRPVVLSKGATQKENEQIFKSFLDGDILSWICEKNYSKIIGHLEHTWGQPFSEALAEKVKSLVFS